MAGFGSKSAEYVKRALHAADVTTQWIGIQATDGLKPKDDDPQAPSLATVAAVHEYGAPEERIPQRSYLRATGDAQGKRWVGAFRAAIQAYAAGDEAGHMQRIRLLGTVASNDVKATIRRRIAPPLSPITVANRRKGRAKDPSGKIADDVPLIDTQQLISSIRSQAVTVAGTILAG